MNYFISPLKLILQINSLKKELRKYRRFSLYDFLTGLYNRRKLEQDIERYLDINKRYNVNYLFLMLDINKFKEINDTKGHKVGDKTLKKVASILRKSVRKADKIYRMSGDEFIIICPHSIKDKISYRIKEALKDINIEVSIGKNLLCDNILDIIDKQMYKDKRRIR